MLADKVNILIVDDLPDKLLVLETVLQDLGENILTARSGEEALRQVLDHELAVILLDVNMPGLDGYETAALIRRRKKSALTPIIFVTAYADEMHTVQGYSLGAVDYVLSPVVPAVLRTKVKVFVDLFRMTQQVKQQADEKVALAQEQIARAAAEEAIQRSNFLAEASKVLSSSLDLEATLRGLLRLVVPQLADLSAITLGDDQGKMHQTELAWTDDQNGLCTRTLASPRELPAHLCEALQHVLATGEPQYLPEIVRDLPKRTSHARREEAKFNFAAPREEPQCTPHAPREEHLARQSRNQTTPSPPASGGGEGGRNPAPQHESMRGTLTPSPSSPSPAALPRSGGEGSNSLRPAKILENSSTYGAASQTFPDIEMQWVMILPLLARGKALGALTLALGHSGRRYDRAEQALALDLADRAAIAIDNARLYRNIQEADRRKNEFLSMLAHELRNPLAPIRNGVEIMRLHGTNEQELCQVRDMIERQVEHLVRLVDDLLDISRITRGKIQIHTEPIDVALVVARVLEAARPLLEARRHELTVSLPPEPVRVCADPVRLAQVFTNLLNNAAKYTEEGGKVWLTVAREGGEVVFRVRDTGLGIPAEMLSSVFDPFTQVERSLDRSQGGLGLGLTLVRRIVELHEGTVQACSAGLKQGSEFIVRLPVLTNVPPRETTAGLGRPPAQAGHRHVLVVDDNVDAADSLAILLRLDGHDVHVAHDGPATLTATETFQPEIVLLDIGLPGMDGYEVARRLRQRWSPEELLLVAVTGYGQEEDIQFSRQAGFDHHLVKPIDPDALTALFAELQTV